PNKKARQNRAFFPGLDYYFRRRQTAAPSKARPPSKAMDGSGTTVAETLKSSTAKAWSLPESSMSRHLRNISSPGFKVTPVSKVGPNTVRFAAALPSSAAAVAPTVGLLKFSAVKPVQPLFGSASTPIGLEKAVELTW